MSTLARTVSFDKIVLLKERLYHRFTDTISQINSIQRRGQTSNAVILVMNQLKDEKTLIAKIDRDSVLAVYFVCMNE